MKYCHECGHESTNETKFCQKCGADFGGTTASSVAQQPFKPVIAPQDSVITANHNRTILTIVGWLAALLSVWLFPLFFGTIGIVCGILLVKQSKSDMRGIVLIVASVVLMATGLYIAEVVNQVDGYINDLPGFSDY